MVTHGKSSQNSEKALNLVSSRSKCKLTITTRPFADFTFDEIQKAYDVFQRAAETNALKVNIEF